MFYGARTNMPVELECWARNLQRAYSERDQKNEFVLKAPKRKNYHAAESNSFSIFESD